MQENQLEFGLRIVDIKEIYSSFKDFDVLDIEDSADKIKIGLGFRFSFDKEKELFKTFFQVTYNYEPDNSELLNYQIEVTFQLFNSGNILAIENDIIEYKDEQFLLAVISVVIGTSRGMIAVKTMGMEINKVILPILDAKDLLNNIGLKNIPSEIE